MAFHFERPAGFVFKAGQVVDIGLPALGDGQEARHAFSLVSAPYEHELVIATRMRDSAYKQALKSLEPGQRVLLDGPFGSLTLGKNVERPAVMIAGGIGITPFMSMIGDAAHEGSKCRIILLYSNRRPEDTAFLAELRKLEADLASLQVLATMTQMENSSLPWQGTRGQLDAARLKQLIGTHIDAHVGAIYYVAGPPNMVQALRAGLNGIGVDDDDIRSEDFVGY